MNPLVRGMGFRWGGERLVSAQEARALKSSPGEATGVTTTNNSFVTIGSREDRTRNVRGAGRHGDLVTSDETYKAWGQCERAIQ